MKKGFISFLCATTIMTAAMPAFADGRTPLISTNPLISPNPLISTQIISQKYTIVENTLKINDLDVDLGGLNIYEIENQIMVPLRITAEKLGFTITWDGATRSIHLDNDIMKTDLSIGKDNYFASSSKAIGMAAPKSLGVAPIIIEGSTYVPVEFFKIILSDENSVVVKDNVITIKAESATQIPNPIKNVSTLEDAKNAVGFEILVPAALTEIEGMTVIGNHLVEISYVDDTNRIVYRTAEGNADISGDYNVYENVKTIAVGTTEVSVKGNTGSITLATWTEDGVSFALSFTEGVTEQALTALIESIK